MPGKNTLYDPQFKIDFVQKLETEQSKFQSRGTDNYCVCTRPHG